MLACDDFVEPDRSEKHEKVCRLKNLFAAQNGMELHHYLINIHTGIRLCCGTDGEALAPPAFLKNERFNNRLVALPLISTLVFLAIFRSSLSPDR
jgi:hypothetical protein